MVVVSKRTSAGVTRRQLLRGAGTAAALAAAGVGGLEFLRVAAHPRRIHSFSLKPTGTVRAFHSRPDLRPPTVTASAEPAVEVFGVGDPPGFLFLGPGPVSLSGSQQYGPLMVDRHGEPVWFRPVAPGLEVTNFATANYRGEPVLLWWEGTILGSGYDRGEAVIVDRSYRELARVRAANGRAMDLHAFWLTPQGTALFSCYPETVQADLRSIGGGRRAGVLESIIQEVDVASGQLLFEWRSLQHVPVNESYQPLSEPYDYLHANSITPTPDGNLLVSGRHTWTIYKLERRTGKVIWKLGGKHGQFRIGPGVQFSWQHDARQLSDRLLTVFDNGSNGRVQTEKQSRGLVLEVDEVRRSAVLQAAYVNPKAGQATSMGSVQILPSQRVVVGWGTAAHTSEFAGDDSPFFDASLPSGMYSYRALWLPWQGAPRHKPAVARAPDHDSDDKLIFASWNGATEVSDWRVNAGPTVDRLRPIGIASWRGFETVIRMRPGHKFVSVTALDSAGRQLSRSDPIRL
jgi:hypothetical protein